MFNPKHFERPRHLMNIIISSPRDAAFLKKAEEIKNMNYCDREDIRSTW